MNPPPVNVQEIPSVHLVDQYRDMVMAYAVDHSRTDLLRKIDMFQEEIVRRMAWG